ncbi:MAG: hypothetical protein DRI86_07500 [Bacteroidetes bacterium]|nr:MAG: hypothetical protein DRI86_07500 [Bacteroidota bacterium]
MAKQSIYQREVDSLEQSKAFLKKNEYSKLELQLEFKKNVENYEELIDQVKIITRISDRLQRKLNKTNEALESSNTQLADLNNQLNETIDQLTEAKIGRRASTIVMFIAIGLFIISEAFIEPIIDRAFPDNFWVGLGLKLIVAILIKPGEDFANKYMLKKARKKQLEDAKVAK